MTTRATRSTWRRWVDAPHRAASLLAALVLLVITAVALANVGSRAFAGKPLESSNELIGSWLMVALVYLPLSSAHHIRITMLTSRMPRAVLRWVDGAVVILCVAGLVLAIWATLVAAVISFQTHESTVGLHTFPLGPIRLVICIGLALLCLRVVSSPRDWLAEPRDSSAVGEDGIPAERQEGAN